MGQELLELLGSTFWMILGIAAIFAIYLAISGICWLWQPEDRDVWR